LAGVAVECGSRLSTSDATGDPAAAAFSCRDGRICCRSPPHSGCACRMSKWIHEGASRDWRRPSPPSCCLVQAVRPGSGDGDQGSPPQAIAQTQRLIARGQPRAAPGSIGNEMSTTMPILAKANVFGPKSRPVLNDPKKYRYPFSNAFTVRDSSSGLLRGDRQPGLRECGHPYLEPHGQHAGSRVPSDGLQGKA
jgi:hypothetical protein